MVNETGSQMAAIDTESNYVKSAGGLSHLIGSKEQNHLSDPEGRELKK